MNTPQSEDEFFDQEGAPAEGHAPIPRWLWWVYILSPIFGIIWMWLFWNGSGNGWFDRGAWTQLQEAAKTTYPWQPDHISADEVSPKK